MQLLSRFFELYRFREMIYILVYRDIKARTKQAVLGYLWVIIQPLLATGVFSLLVQGVLRLELTETVPYPVFVFAGMVLWQYFSSSLSESAQSLVTNLSLLTQVYFPKDILILYPIFAKLVDLGISLAMLVVMLILYRISVHWTLVFIPLFVLVAMLFAYALGLFLAPLNVAFRDVARALPILLSLALYATPALYPLERVPLHYRNLYLLNPMAVVVEGFRRVLFEGTLPPLWALGWATVLTVGLLLIGQALFQLFEKVLADVV